MQNPYIFCPTYETDSFIIRLVKESDAVDLLTCYSDPKAQELFNCDRCFGDFKMSKLEDMKSCIKAWLMAYENGDFIRFSIIDKTAFKAVGTIEMFGSVGKTNVTAGILRVDIASRYEELSYLDELFRVTSEHFFNLFKVTKISTKAIPLAKNRIDSIKRLGYKERVITEGNHYYSLTR